MRVQLAPEPSDWLRTKLPFAAVFSRCLNEQPAQSAEPLQAPHLLPSCRCRFRCLHRRAEPPRTRQCAFLGLVLCKGCPRSTPACLGFCDHRFNALAALFVRALLGVPLLRGLPHLQRLRLHLLGLDIGLLLLNTG